MARTKTFNETKALDAAMMLFWKRGYAATSIGELEEVMGLKRTSIYNAYGNKRTLFQKSLEHYFTQIGSTLLEPLHEAELSLLEAIEQLFDGVVTYQFNPDYPGGCLIVLSALESHQHDEATNTTLHALFKTMQQVIETRLQRAVDTKELSSSCPCSDAASQIVATMTGMVFMAKAGADRAVLEKVAASAMKSLFCPYEV